MAATPADAEREIGRLRGDLTAAVEEIERRLRGGLRGVAQAEARVTSTRAREEAMAKVRENPPVLAVGGVVVAGAIAYAAFAFVSGLRERRKPQNRLRRRVEGVRSELGERVESSRRQLERVRQRGILVKLDRADGGYLRLTDARLEPPNKKSEGSTVIKKLVWAALLSVFMALGSVLARRVADQVWRGLMQEEPPTEKSKAAS
jgi:hypothetical protein